MAIGDKVGLVYMLAGTGTNNLIRAATNPKTAKLIPQNIATFERYGVKKIVTPCPHCFNTLQHEYGKLDPPSPVPGGEGFEVLHHSQLLAELIAEGKLKAAASGDMTYHDPCYLARVNNESDAPRAVLGKESSLNDRNVLPDASDLSDKLREPAHYARKTLCCGAGGGRMWMEETRGTRINVARTEQVLATGADTLATACPFCMVMLRDGLQDAGRGVGSEAPVTSQDIAELLASAIVPGTGGPVPPGRALPVV